MRLHDGDKIVFFGDSITKANFGSNYINALTRLLSDNSVKNTFTFVNAGRDGDMVADLVSRAQLDVLSREPDWVVINIGINDVFYESIFMANPAMETEDGKRAGFKHMIGHFRHDYSSLIDILKGRIKNIALCTTTGIEGPTDLSIVERLAAVNDTIRMLAHENDCPLIDVATAFKERLGELRKAGHIEEYVLTVDGVHLNHRGAQVVADALFEFFIKN